MRIACCVMRVVILCVGLVACSNTSVLLTTPVSTPHIESPQTPAPLSVQAALKPMGMDCTGDTEAPLVAAGWKLLWQKVFDNAIARPPVVDGSQVVFIERSDPDPYNMKDTALVIDPQSGIIQWKIVDAQQPVQFVSRRVISAQASQKYWLFVLQYLKPDQLGTPNPVQYEVVVDRQSGQVVYDSGVLSDAMVTAISDEALFDRYTFSFMRRVDLPSEQTRWTNYWDTWSPIGLFTEGHWLYYFGNDRYASKYDSLSGTLVTSMTMGLAPDFGGVIVAGQVAVGRGNDVEAIDLQTFSPIWRAGVSSFVNLGSNAYWDNLPSMIATSDSVYLFDGQNALLRLDLQTGRTVWRVPLPGTQAMSRPIVVNGLVYGFFGDGTVRAYSEADGTQLGVALKVPLWYWKDTDAKEWRDLVGGLGVAGDTLIVTTGCRSVYAIQRAQ